MTGDRCGRDELPLVRGDSNPYHGDSDEQELIPAGVFVLPYNRRVVRKRCRLAKKVKTVPVVTDENEMVASCALEDSLRNHGRLQKMVMLLVATFLSGARILHCQGAEVEQFTLRQKDAPA